MISSGDFHCWLCSSIYLFSLLDAIMKWAESFTSRFLDGHIFYYGLSLAMILVWLKWTVYLGKKHHLHKLSFQQFKPGYGKVIWVLIVWSVWSLSAFMERSNVRLKDGLLMSQTFERNIIFYKDSQHCQHHSELKSKMECQYTVVFIHCTEVIITDQYQTFPHDKCKIHIHHNTHNWLHNRILTEEMKMFQSIFD